MPGLPLAVGGPSYIMKRGASGRSDSVRRKTSLSSQCFRTVASNSGKLTRLDTGLNISAGFPSNRRSRATGWINNQVFY